jgi:hypothetical protein
MQKVTALQLLSQLKREFVVVFFHGFILSGHESNPGIKG